MLLDNKTKTEDNEYFKVFDFLKNYIEKGNLDLVTGYFSVNALALLNEDTNQAESFRMILGNLLQDESQENKIIDLLNGDAGIGNTLSLSLSAKKAVAFLQQQKVSVKTYNVIFAMQKLISITIKTHEKTFT